MELARSQDNSMRSFLTPTLSVCPSTLILTFGRRLRTLARFSNDGKDNGNTSGRARAKYIFLRTTVEFIFQREDDGLFVLFALIIVIGYGCFPVIYQKEV